MRLSRTALLLLPLATPLPAEPLATYQALTRVAVRQCSRAKGPDEIVVCARRRADDWRAPLIGYEPGDPRGEGVLGERQRLARGARPPCGQEAIIANCGPGVGVGVSTSLGGGGLRVRTPAD